MDIFIMKKRHDSNGNPIYVLFIPDLDEKIKGLRKLKRSNHYSISSYNLISDLKNYAFKGKPFHLKDMR